MKIGQQIEQILHQTLPARVFGFLATGYQAAKTTAKKTLNNTRIIFNSIAKRLNTGRKTLINLDMYGWTEVDIPEHLLSRFKNQVLILKPGVSWIDYETDSNSYVGVTSANYHYLVHEGLLLWEVSKVSIMKYLGKIIIPGTTIPEDADLSCISKFYTWSVKCHEIISKVLDSQKPDYILLTQGGVYDSRIIAELARRKGVVTIALENSFSSAHFYADTLTGQILNRHSIMLTGGFINECDAKSLVESEQEVIRFFHQSIENKAEQHKSGDAADVSQLRHSLSIPADKKIILFLGQVRTDASIVLDSTLYPDPIFLIKELAAIVNEVKDYVLIIRLHPKEATLNEMVGLRDYRELCYNATLNELSKQGIFNSDKIRIISDRQTNTYSLMKISQVGITINSQSGLEMALMNLPVITAGRCFYANKGFTLDLTSPELLRATIDCAINLKQNEQQKQNLMRFCHYLFYQYLISKDFAGNPQRLYRLLDLDY